MYRSGKGRTLKILRYFFPNIFSMPLTREKGKADIGSPGGSHRIDGPTMSLPGDVYSHTTSPIFFLQHFRKPKNMNCSSSQLQLQRERETAMLLPPLLLFCRGAEPDSPVIKLVLQLFCNRWDSPHFLPALSSWSKRAAFWTTLPSLAGLQVVC